MRVRNCVVASRSGFFTVREADAGGLTEAGRLG
jgi:hypothetical protein